MLNASPSAEYIHWDSFPSYYDWSSDSGKVASNLVAFLYFFVNLFHYLLVDHLLYLPSYILWIKDVCYC